MIANAARSSSRRAARIKRQPEWRGYRIWVPVEPFGAARCGTWLLRRSPHDPSHRDRCHAHCRHRAVGYSSKCPIARSGPARAGAVGTHVGATTVYRAATDLHFSETWRDTPAHDVSAWTAPIASVHAQSLIFAVQSPTGDIHAHHGFGFNRDLAFGGSSKPRLINLWPRLKVAPRAARSKLRTIGPS
jgi:hypothetical protein